jgi:hypothetical protein
MRALRNDIEGYYSLMCSIRKRKTREEFLLQWPAYLPALRAAIHLYFDFLGIPE